MLDQAECERLSQSFAQLLEDYSGAEQLFTPDAFFDINVPGWRFQLDQPRDFVAWCADSSTKGYRIRPRTVVATSPGFAFEFEGEYLNLHGEELFFRNLVLYSVKDGRINEVSYWCTGDWDAEMRAQHKAEVQLLRP